MTIAFGYSFGDYAVLGADTRTTYASPLMEFYDDNSQKVQRTSMGIITGAGFCPLLDSVKRRLATETVLSTDRIIAIVREERDAVRSTWSRYQKIGEWINQTGWIFTYNTQNEGQPLLRLAILHPRLGEDIDIYQPRQPAVIWPVEVGRELSESLSGVMRDRLGRVTDTQDLQNGIGAVSAVLGLFVTTLQPMCRSISSRFQVGAHYRQLTGVSEIVSPLPDGRFNFQLSMS